MSFYIEPEMNLGEPHVSSLESLGGIVLFIGILWAINNIFGEKALDKVLNVIFLFFVVIVPVGMLIAFTFDL